MASRSLPEIAATSVNRLVDFFRDKHLEVFSESQSGFLQSRLQSWQATLKEHRQQLQELQSSTGLVDAVHQKTLLLSERSTLELERRKAERERAELAERTSVGPDYGSTLQNEVIPALLKRREDTAAKLTTVTAELAEAERQIAILIV